MQFKLRPMVAAAFKELLREERVCFTSWPACKDDDIYVATEAYDRNVIEELLQNAIESCKPDVSPAGERC